MVADINPNGDGLYSFGEEVGMIAFNDELYFMAQNVT